MRLLIFPQPLDRALKNQNAAPTTPPCFSRWLRSSLLLFESSRRTKKEKPEHGCVLRVSGQFDFSRMNARGAGLGLNICKVLVNLSGGQIRVESQQGEWCRFVFTLPTVAPNPGGMKRLPDEAGGEPVVEDPASMKPVE